MVLSFQISLHFLALLISLKASMYILLYIFYTVRHVNVCYFVAKIVLRKNCSSDRENLLKFKTKVREFAKYLRSLKHLKVSKIFETEALFNVFQEVSQI